jgi:hypothetical protein
MRRVLLVFLLLLVLLWLGCAARFADREILWRDPDDDPIPKPERQILGDNFVRFRSGFFLAGERVLLIDGTTEAQDVNALDELPDSSWFFDARRAAQRAGRPFGPAEVAASPLPAPSERGPYTIIQGKSIGASRGVVVKDSAGAKFIFKWDAPGYFGLATATEVVAARLVAAGGWRVPSLTMLELDREDLVLAPDVTYRDKMGEKRRYTADMLDKMLVGVPRAPSGRYRVSAGRWLEGEAMGSYSYIGRRSDDPNDRIPHEDRRSLRGFGVFAAWINDVDTVDMNTLDMYVKDDRGGHLVHYVQDVGGSFGNYAVGPLAVWMGSESYFNGWRVLGALFSFGAWTRPWARPEVAIARDKVLERWPELGWFDAEHFNPKRWSPLWRNPAFDRATARDRYWGTKRVLSISAEELRAAIAVGGYRPEVAERLFDILWQRREKIARAFLDQVAPLDDFRFEGTKLCFDDLMARYGFAPRAEYLVRGASSAEQGPPSGACVVPPVRDGLAIIELRVRRSGWKRPGPLVRVHVVTEGDSRRLIGIER